MTDGRGRTAQLYAEVGPVVYRRCLRLLRDPEAARDATQEVFMKLMRNVDRLADRETMLPWIFRVATNHCLNRRRDAARRGEQGESRAPEDLPLSAAAPASSLTDRVLVQGLLSRFDPDTQTVAVGVLVDGMEHEEVAAVLGISRRTVARRLDRFLEGARKYLDRGEERSES
jgi:RNA polymerase sigma-70 factor (ECF subfamily)